MPDNLDTTETTGSGDTIVPPEEMSILQKRMLRQMDEPVFANDAVARCIEAYEKGCRETMQNLVAMYYKSHDDEPSFELLTQFSEPALRNAGNFYREVMPPLSGGEKIRNFIACVAHGIVLKVFVDNEGSKLIYAAQVAALNEAKRYKSRLG